MESEMLFLRGTAGIVAIVKAGPYGQYFLETENEEIVLGLEPHDLIVASAFSVDEKTEKGLKCVLFMIREIRSPLIVLPKDHPASARLPIVVSAGKKTVLNCNITPGTHPNQDVLCGSNEFDRVELTGTPDGVQIKNLPPCAVLKVNFDI
ncbi:hypothetical protein MSSAC_2181 [Methanosarcina siciliae C2J]|uniref:Uncharacterized protein n=4 Tax=Methanosarcina siciliae TaxID=38027 RepID=A0A0E3PDA6_9EURY|nr:hypothetical protein [Methanosarcina siciliae]AKB28534.1 hypothetical protein MSSIT_1815 [Methanosarcina siciliae T4/M]AKB32445.1 hypothetical protein MSSIH_1755 [Methanosarcina siciliae HI350]AKB36771.1 hypothetical protein MSSAC_2181 [Methanosarcina siciliae C2J]